MYLLLFLLAAFPLHAQLDAGRWAVAAPSSPLYETADSPGLASFILPYAYSFRAKNRKNARVSLTYEGREYWINTNTLVRVDFSAQNFSSENAPFIPAEIKEGSFSFIYGGALYQLDLSTLETPKIDKIGDVPRRTGAYFSPDGSLLLLAGKGKGGLNLAFLAGRKFVALSLLAGDSALISAEFSPSNKYAALHISLGEEQKLLVFKVDTGELLSSFSKAEGFRWAEGLLAFSQGTSVSLFNPEGSLTRLYTHPKNKQIQAVFASPADEFLVDIDNTVYRLKGGALEKTAYASIERSPSGMLQSSVKNGESQFFYGKTLIRPLSGTKPRWDFTAFAGDHGLLYTAKAGAITTLYYYDAAKNQSSPYRWVEEPAQALAGGLAYEAVEDNGEIWLFFERPGGKANMLRLGALLK